MTKPQKPFRSRAWDATNPRYASLDNPEWVFMDRLPVFFWEDETNHKRYMEWLGNQLGFTDVEDWYRVTTKDFTERRGHGFLEYYDNSPFVVVKHHFPRFDWKPWLFRQAPNGFWHDLNNCFAYVQWFEKQRGFTSTDGWYGITQDDVFELNGSGLLDHFDCSVQRLVEAVYPERDWKPWLFVQVPKNFWPRKKNRVAYMRWLESKLGFDQPDDWYRVSKLDFIKNQGASLMQVGYKTVDLIRELYPERDWHPWLFKQVFQGYWAKKSHRVKYLVWLGKQLGFETLEDWKSVKRQDFMKHLGGNLFTEHFANDLSKAVKELFPESTLMPWEFHQVPGGFWAEAKNCRSYLEWLGNRLEFVDLDDWYRVRRSDFRENLGNGFIKHFKTPYFGLKSAYPNHLWLPWMFENVPVGFWDQASNRSWYLTWLGKQLRLRTGKSWEGLTAVQLRSHRGNGILAKMSVKEIREAGKAIATSDS